MCSQTACHFIVAHRRHQRIGVTVRGAPACTGDCLRQVRVDASGFVAGDHADIDTVCSGTVCQTCQDLLMLGRAAQTEVALLIIFHVGIQHIRKLRPDVLNGVHHQRQFSGITSGLTNTAAVAGGAAVADIFAALQHKDRNAVFCKVIRCRTANDAAANNDDFCIHFVSSLSFASTFISIGRMGALPVAGPNSLGRTPSSRDTMPFTSLVQVCP